MGVPTTKIDLMPPTTLNTSLFTYVTTPIDVLQLLRSLEDAEAFDLLPALITLGLFAIVGVVGNTIALVVYYKKFKPSSTRTYIVTISIFDLLFNILVIPGEILDLRFSMTYNYPWLCRTVRAYTAFLTLVSGFILVAVALERRRKILHPFRQQFTERQTKMSIVWCSLTAIIISVPYVIANGHHSVKVEGLDVTGSACSIDDAFIDSYFPLLCNVLFVVAFFACFGAMTTSYVQIARRIVKHKRITVGLEGRLSLAAHFDDGSVSGSGRQTPRSTPGEEESSFVHSDDVFISRKNCESTTLALNKLTERRKEQESLRGKIERNSPGKIFKGISVSLKIAESNSQFKFPPENTEQPASQEKVENFVSALHSGVLMASDQKLLENGETESETKCEKIQEQDMQSITHAASETNIKSHKLLSDAESILLRSRCASDGYKFSNPDKLFPGRQQPMQMQQCEPVKEKLFQDSSEPKEALKCEPVNDKHFQDSSERKQALICEPVNDKHFQDSSERKQALICEQIKDSKNTKQENSVNYIRETDSTTDVEPFPNKGPSPTPEVSTYTNGIIDELSDRRDNISYTKKLSATHVSHMNTLLHKSLSRIKTMSLDDESAHSSASSLRRHRSRRKIPNRTTWMMFVLAAIFIVSFMPHLVIQAIRAVSHKVEVGLEGWALNFYNIALRSYFINSIVNPLVYGFCSERFRYQCRIFFVRSQKMSISD